MKRLKRLGWRPMLKPSRRLHWSPEDFPPGTEGIRLCRIVRDDLRLYEVMLFESGASGIAWFLNRWFIHGDSIDDEGAYGQIDVMGDDGWVILDDIGIADRRAFQRLRVKLGCKVESPECGVAA